MSFGRALPEDEKQTYRPFYPHSPLLCQNLTPTLPTMQLHHHLMWRWWHEAAHLKLQSSGRTFQVPQPQDLSSTTQIVADSTDITPGEVSGSTQPKHSRWLILVYLSICLPDVLVTIPGVSSQEEPCKRAPPALRLHLHTLLLSWYVSSGRCDLWPAEWANSRLPWRIPGSHPHRLTVPVSDKQKW